jgi:hypothetical protein
MDYHDLKNLIHSFPQLTHDSGEEACYRAFTETLSRLSHERSGFSLERDKEEIARFREVMLPVVHESEFCGYAYDKPRGYAGDFVTQEMIWFGRTQGGPRRYAGSTEAGRILNSVTLDMENSRANEERMGRLRDFIRTGGGRLMSVGCGPCIELWGVRETRSDHLDIVLIDQDAGALERARSQLLGLTDASVTYLCQNVLKFAYRPDENLRGTRDLVWVFGLLDYFDAAMARRIVAGLWSLVAPGGRLIVTNVKAHPHSATRTWMEYGGNWFLSYKDEQTFQALSADLSDVRDQSVSLDSHRIYQYLEITRNS